MPESKARRLREIVSLFLRMGFTAFGGPAAHIAIMHDEVVVRRKWLTDEEFLDLVGATNLIPGPNSTEMAIHIGFLRAGRLGLILGGACFILPAVAMVMALAWVYVRYGSTPQAEWLLYGIKPVVIAIILQALWILGRKAVKGPLLAIVGMAVAIFYFLGVNELLLLLVGGLVVMVGSNLRRLRSLRSSAKGMLMFPFMESLQLFDIPAIVSTPFSLPIMFLTFLKIGAILFGGGYVLLAFLHSDFVVRHNWLTNQQLLDAIAIGQVTPGPLFTSATFIGYLLAGVPGALLATLGIFLPAFFFVAISNPLIPKIRNSPWLRSLLDGVNAASLGLMAAVTWRLGRASIIDPVTVIISVISLGLLLRFKVNSTWLILGGALAGFLTVGHF